MLIKKYLKRKPENAQSVGLIFISISILLGQFVHGRQLIDFIEGLLMGISVPLLLVGIYFSSKKIRDSTKIQEEQRENN